MRYTKEELEKMPLEFVRNVDVATLEEEALLQEVVDRKMLAQPIIGAPLDVSYKTDNMTPEKEAELQAEIDAHNAKMRASLQEALMELAEEEPAEEEVTEEELDAAIALLPEEVVPAPKKEKKIKHTK